MTLLRKPTKKQLRQAESERARAQTGWIREASTKAWHVLKFEGEIGLTVCGLIVRDSDRRGMPSPGALICGLCAVWKAR